MNRATPTEGRVRLVQPVLKPTARRRFARVDTQPLNDRGEFGDRGLERSRVVACRIPRGQHLIDASELLGERWGTRVSLQPTGDRGVDFVARAARQQPIEQVVRAKVCDAIRHSALCKSMPHAAPGSTAYLPAGSPAELAGVDIRTSWQSRHQNQGTLWCTSQFRRSRREWRGMQRVLAWTRPFRGSRQRTICAPRLTPRGAYITSPEPQTRA